MSRFLVLTFLALLGVFYFASFGVFVVKSENFIYRYRAEHSSALTLPATIDFSSAAVESYLLKGFFYSEGWGRWSDGKRSLAILKLAKIPPFGIDCELELEHVFLPNAERKLRCRIFFNDQIVVDRWYGGGEPFEPKLEFRVESEFVNHVNYLRIEIDDPGRPMDYSDSSDRRLLGLGYKALSITAREEE